MYILLVNTEADLIFSTFESHIAAVWLLCRLIDNENIKILFEQGLLSALHTIGITGARLVRRRGPRDLPMDCYILPNLL